MTVSTSRAWTRYPTWLRVLFVLACFAPFALVPALSSVASAQASPDPLTVPDLVEIVVADTEVSDFTVLNGTVFYARCFGDLGTDSSELKMQQVDTPTSNQSLLILPECYRFRLLQADPTAVYHKNEPARTIERRLLADISNAIVLANYVPGTEPTAMALADGYVYWTAADSAIRRVSIYGGAVELVVPITSGEPNDLSIDDFYLWFGTTSGVFRMDRDCNLPCTPYQQRTGIVKKVHGASTGTLPGEVSIFWVKLGVLGAPDTVESWDGNIPGYGGIKHTVHRIADLGTIDAVAATDDHVWWLERIGTGGTGQLRRISRGVAEDPDNGPFSERMDQSVAPQRGWLPGRLQLYNEDFYYRSNGISRVNQYSPPLIWDFSAQHLEITQGQQNLESDGWMVADKRTFVRFYGQQLLGNDLAYPEAHLEGFVGGVPLPGSPLAAIVSPNLLVSGADFDRTDIDTTWLFELPPQWIGPDEILLRATIDPRRLYDDDLAGNTLQHYMTFYDQVPVCLVAIKVRQHGPTASWNDLEYVHATTQMLDMTPTDRLELHHQGTKLEEGVWPFESPYELPEDKAKILQNLWWRNLWSDDPDDCDGDSGEGSTHYVGLIHNQTSTGTAIGRAYTPGDELWIKLPSTAGTTQGWPVAQRSAVLAHEAFHNYGRLHVNCSGGLSGPDPNYPGNLCDLAQLTTDSGVYWGFEPRTQTPISPTMAADVMTYQGTEWTSRYTWMGMFNQLYPTEGPVEGSKSTNTSLVLVAGEINPFSPSRSSLSHAWVMQLSEMGNSMQRKWADLETPEADPQTTELIDYSVQFLNSHGQVLATHLVQPVSTDEPLAGPDPVHFGLTAPPPSGVVAQLRLRSGSTVIAQLQFGPASPVLRILEPAAGTSADQTLTVRWESYDPDGDLPHFMVQYQAGPSDPWQTLAADLIGEDDVAQYEITVDSSQLPGGTTNSAVVKVVASDGYHTTTALSPRFSVPRRAPQAVIVWPPPDTWLEPGESITLEGWGTDAEDGWLAEVNLAWSLDGTNLGTGASKQVQGLAPGSHLVRLTARDSHGQRTTVQRTFDVSPLEVARGRVKLDGRCNDFGYANSPLVALQPYAAGSQARVLWARDDHYLWACFSGLRNQGPSSPGSFAGIRVDGNFSQDPLAQANDYAYFVGQDGMSFAYRGDGAGGFSSDPPSFISHSLAAFVRSNPGGTTWNAELRIQIDFTGLGEHMGLKAGHYWVNAQGNDYNWPYSAVWNEPDTWAEGWFDTVPKLFTLDPTTATLPVTLGAITLTGENFRNGDEVLWDGSPLPLIVVNGPTQIIQLVGPTQLTPGVHEVRVARGTGNIVSSPLHFTVFNPVPTITGPYPPNIPQGSTGASFQIYAPDATLGAQVFLDGQSLTTWYQGLGWITAYPTDEQMAKPGVKTVTLRNAQPVAQMSNGLALTITPCGLAGDFNHDLVVDVADLVSIAGHWDESAPPYDLDNSGRVTVRDIMMVVAGFGDTCP